MTAEAAGPGGSGRAESVLGGYEGLRRNVLGRRSGWGCWGASRGSGSGEVRSLGEGLLRRRGLAAWMCAWDEAVAAREPPKRGRGEREGVPQAALSGEMVCVLARMALCAATEEG